ncbi:MAG: sortase [Candidatus Nomurabacteria bacterium]|nr:sortase [Candidatus Nomurabacteria bacterium]
MEKTETNFGISRHLTYGRGELRIPERDVHLRIPTRSAANNSAASKPAASKVQANLTSTPTNLVRSVQNQSVQRKPAPSQTVSPIKTKADPIRVVSPAAARPTATIPQYRAANLPAAKLDPRQTFRSRVINLKMSAAAYAKPALNQTQQAAALAQMKNRLAKVRAEQARAEQIKQKRAEIQAQKLAELRQKQIQAAQLKQAEIQRQKDLAGKAEQAKLAEQKRQQLARQRQIEQARQLQSAKIQAERQAEIQRQKQLEQQRAEQIRRQQIEQRQLAEQKRAKLLKQQQARKSQTAQPVSQTEKILRSAAANLENSAQDNDDDNRLTEILARQQKRDAGVKKRFHKPFERKFKFSDVLRYGVVAAILVVAGYFGVNTYITNRQARAAFASSSTSLAVAGDNDGPSNLDETTISNEQKTSYSVAYDMPRYLEVPAIGVTQARVLNVGVTSSGQIDSPKSIYDVGWYNGSAKPGDDGAAFIDGQTAGLTMPGVFDKLSDLKAGDQITLQMGDDSKISYKVAKVEQTTADKVDMLKALTVYNNGEQGLNLMTSSGAWDPTTKSYDHRTIVYAVRE